MAEIHRFMDAEELARAAAAFIAKRGAQAIGQKGRFSLALAGGSTPSDIYRRLPQVFLQHRIEWRRVHVFWGDERCVPLDHPSSNFRTANEDFLASVPIPLANVHPIRCAEDPPRGAEAYEKTLRDHFGRAAWPAFDLVLLGLGADGHTASLFPGSPSLDEAERWVAADYVTKLESWRVSLTPPAINASGSVAFLVRGKEKSKALRHVLQGESDPHRWPAQIIQPKNGSLHWFVDEAAAVLLDPL